MHTHKQTYTYKHTRRHTDSHTQVHTHTVPPFLMNTGLPPWYCKGNLALASSPSKRSRQPHKSHRQPSLVEITSRSRQVLERAVDFTRLPVVAPFLTWPRFPPIVKSVVSHWLSPPAYEFASGVTEAKKAEGTAHVSADKHFSEKKNKPVIQYENIKYCAKGD